PRPAPSASPTPRLDPGASRLDLPQAGILRAKRTASGEARVLYASDSLNSVRALVRPILRRSASLVGAGANQSAGWLTFSNGQSIENSTRSAPSSIMAASSVWV